MQQLSKDQIAIVKKLDKTAFEDLLNKPQVEILQYLIQAQIDEINAQTDLSKDDKRLRYNLRKELIAVENQKQKENSTLIDAINKTDAQIAGLRGALLENATLEKNAKISSLREKIIKVEGISKDKD